MAKNDAEKVKGGTSPSGSSAFGTHKYKCAVGVAISQTGSAAIS